MKWLIIAQATWDGTPTKVTDRSADTHSFRDSMTCWTFTKKMCIIYGSKVLPHWVTQMRKSTGIFWSWKIKWRLHMFNWYLISMFLHFYSAFSVLNYITVGYVTAYKWPTRYEVQLAVFTDWSCVQVYTLWQCMEIFWWTHKQILVIKPEAFNTIRRSFSKGA